MIALKINTSMMFSINKKGVYLCYQCKLPAHTTVSNTEIRKVEDYNNLTCFEIMHLKSNEDIWYKYEDNGVGRWQLCKYHPFYISVKDLLKVQLSRQ